MLAPVTGSPVTKRLSGALDAQPERPHDTRGDAMRTRIEDCGMALTRIRISLVQHYLPLVDLEGTTNLQLPAGSFWGREVLTR